MTEATLLTKVGERSELAFTDGKPRKYLGVILYGPEGLGKSTAALSAPGPIIYANADRIGGSRFARNHYKGKELHELPLYDAQSVRAVLGSLYLELRDGKLDGAKTIVLDSLGRLYDLVLADLAKDDKHPTLPERGDTNTFIERYILSLLELPFHVVLVAHDNPVVTSGNEEAGTSDVEVFPFTGTNTVTLAKKLMRAVDIVGYCGTRTIDKPPEELPLTMYRLDDGTVVEHTAQLFGAGGRRAKETTGVLGQFAPLDLTQWIAEIGEAYQFSGSPAATNNGSEK